MFEIFNLVGTAIQFGIYAIQPQIVMLNQHDVELPEVLMEVRPVEFQRMMNREDPICTWSGVLVPYARDWDEITETEYGQQVRKAEPDKIAGYAFILDKKTCGNNVYSVAMADSYWGGLAGVMRAGLQRSVNDLTITKGDARPRWLEQVAGRLESLDYKEAATAARIQPKQNSEQEPTQAPSQVSQM